MHVHLSTLSGFVVAALAAPAVAQTDFTSPFGLGTSEGSFVSVDFGTPTITRLQQIDDTVSGGVMQPIGQLSWRRDNMARATTASGTIDLEVFLGHGNWTNRTPNFASNYLTSPTRVLPTTTVNFPDWTQAPPVAPAAFDFVVPLQSLFAYNGVDALVFELATSNSSSAGPLFADAHTQAGFTVGSPTPLGTGCTVSGQMQPFTGRFLLQNFGPMNPMVGMRVIASAEGAPPSGPLTLNIDTMDQALPFPGLCTTLRALPTVALPLGSSNASGTLADVTFDLPYNAGLEGLTLVSQMAALDVTVAPPALPIALSGGVESAFPFAPATTATIDCSLLVGDALGPLRLYDNEGLVTRVQ